MAVTLVNNTGLSHYLNGMAIKFDLTEYIPAKIFDVAEDDRGYDLCCIEQLVLADDTGIANQNDITGFMFRVGDITETLDIYLLKNGVQVAQINNSTYGTYYAINSITTYAGQELLTGVSLEWSKVLADFGEGVYQLQINYNGLFAASVEYSSKYRLRTYSNASAMGTIRIESVMNGYMLRERINYKDLNFVDMIRVKGFFGNAEEEVEVTNDVYATLAGENRVIAQRKVNQIDVYKLETHPLPKCLADKIKYYHFFGNTVYVSDYNYINYDYGLKRVRVYKDTAFEFTYTGTTRAVIIKGKLKEQIQDLQKTNCSA